MKIYAWSMLTAFELAVEAARQTGRRQRVELIGSGPWWTFQEVGA